MIISLVKDDPKHNPSGKGQFSPRYSLKGNPSSIWSSSNLPHSRKEQPLSPPRSDTCVCHAKNLLQSRLPGPVRWEGPSKVGGRSSMFQMCPYIHLSKMKNSVMKFHTSMLPGWWGTPENELTLGLHAYSIMANAVGSPAHLGSGIYLFTRALPVIPSDWHLWLHLSLYACLRFSASYLQFLWCPLFPRIFSMLGTNSPPNLHRSRLTRVAPKITSRK